MADKIETKGKETEKSVPEKDFVAFKEASKNREAKLKEQLEQLNNQISELQGQITSRETTISRLKTNLEDDNEVKELWETIQNADKEIDNKRAQYDKDLKSLEKTQRDFRAEKLVAEYQAKGLQQLTKEELLEAENMDALVKEKHLEFLREENEKLKTSQEKGSPEEVFEGGEGRVITKSVADMNIETDEGRKEFETYWNNLVAGAQKK